MARPLRIEYPGAFYHVINRGHRQEAIVLDDRDRQRFLHDLERMVGQFRVLVHSYCLMTNHYHLILETPDGNLSRAVQWLNVSYATYYNRRHQCAGHLFQGRFKAILVDASAYLEALSRYIHLNPVHGGLASRAWEYPWSSCRHFVQPGEVPAWLEVNRILAGFGRTGTVARRRYAAYLSEAHAANPFDDVVGGSLLGPRSFIQWVKSTFLSARRPRRGDSRPQNAPAAAVGGGDCPRGRGEVADHSRADSDARSQTQPRRDVAIYLSRELSGLSCQELGQRFGGLSGAAITMRHSFVLREMAKDRRLTADIAHIRRSLANS